MAPNTPKEAVAGAAPHSSYTNTASVDHSFSSSPTDETTPLLSNAEHLPATTTSCGLFQLRPSPWLIIPPTIVHAFAFALCHLPLQAFFLERACLELGVTSSPPSPSNLTMNTSSAYFPVAFPTPSATAVHSWDDPQNVCRASKPASALAAKWFLMYTLFSSIPAIVATPIVGVLGDRVGRRPVVILSALALWVNIASVVAVGRGFPFFVIFIGAFICGACGNWQAMILGMSSYISDSASPDLRTQFFSLSDALGTSAALIAPFIGGQAAVQFGPVGSFYLSLFIQTLVALYVIFIVPESLNFGVSERTGQAAGTSSEEEVATKKLNWGDAAWFALSSAFKSIATLRGRSRTLLAVFLFLGDCINAGLGGYIALFFMLRFGWTTGDVGEYLLVVAGYRIFYLAIVLPGAVWAFLVWRKRKGSRGGGGGEEGGNSGDNTFEETRARFGFDMGLVRIGLVLMAIGYAALGIAPEGWMLYFISLGYGFAYTVYTNARGVLSRCTPPDEQGRLFAAINVIAAIGSTVGGALFGLLYAATVTTMPSAMLFVMSAYAVVVLVVLSFVKKDELAHLATAASSSRSEEVETS